MRIIDKRWDYFGLVIMFTVIVIFWPDLMAILNAQNTTAEVEPTDIKYQTDIPATTVPAYYKFGSSIPVLRNNNLILAISITEFFDNGSIKQLRSKFLEGTDFSSFTEVQIRIVNQAKENATHLFKFNYEWIRIQEITDPTKRQQETDILVDGVLTSLKYGDIPDTAVKNLIDDLELLVREKLLQINQNIFYDPPARLLTERFFLFIDHVVRKRRD